MFKILDVFKRIKRNSLATLKADPAEEDTVEARSSKRSLSDARLVLPSRSDQSTRPSSFDQISFESRFHEAIDRRAVDQHFEKLCELLLDAVQNHNTEARLGSVAKLIHLEQGQSADGRLIAYFKPFNQKGWLLERSGSGWRMTMAEKIAADESFLRSHLEPWDVTQIYTDDLAEAPDRIQSLRFGPMLMSLSSYHQCMLKSFLELLKRPIQ